MICPVSTRNVGSGRSKRYVNDGFPLESLPQVLLEIGSHAFPSTFNSKSSSARECRTRAFPKSDISPTRLSPNPTGPANSATSSLANLSLRPGGVAGNGTRTRSSPRVQGALYSFPTSCEHNTTPSFRVLRSPLRLRILQSRNTGEALAPQWLGGFSSAVGGADAKATAHAVRPFQTLTLILQPTIDAHAWTIEHSDLISH